MSSRLTLLLPLLVAPTLIPSCTAKASKAPATVGGLEQLAGFVGDWKGTHDVAGSETAYPASYHILREGDTMVWKFSSEFAGGMSGTATTRWDADAGEFVESWSDSTSEVNTISHGHWDAENSTLTATTTVPSTEDPEVMVDYRYVTRLEGDHFEFTMIQIDPAGPEQEVMWIHMDRQ